MEIENSSLYREIAAIISSPAKPVHFTWAADLHVGGETYRALKVLSIDFAHDYERDFGETIICRLLLPAGTFAKRVYPNMSNMDITLYRHPLSEVADTADANQSPESERYTATLLDKGNPILEGNANMSVDEQALNLTTMWEIDFQLVNKALEQLRMIVVGGIFRSTTVEEVVKGVLTRESQKVQVEGVRMPQGVDMVEASNAKERDHIVIPQGTRLVDVPALVQNTCGIYNAGLGYYMQGDFWYVYPCYDSTRFNKADKTLTVINVPPNKFPGVERTYRQDGRTTVVLATGQMKMRDDSDRQQLNGGNGIRFADASKFMDGFGQTKNNKTVLSRGANASEFISIERPNGNNNVQMSPARISMNVFQEYSRLARRQGSFISFVWENSLPSVIFPGMVAKVLYLVEDEIREVFGVVLKVHHYTALQGQGITSMRYRTTSAVQLFVEHRDEI